MWHRKKREKRKWRKGDFHFSWKFPESSLVCATSKHSRVYSVECLDVAQGKKRKKKMEKGLPLFPGNFLKVPWYVPDPNTVDYIV